MAVKVHKNVEQGTEEWLAMRCGLITASEMKLIITPSKLQFAKNDKCRAHVYELAAQRITQYVEPMYISDDMLRGTTDEIEARSLYGKLYAPVEEVGFITNDSTGHVMGYSPDGLVGDDGLIEIKSRRQKFQIQTIVSGGAPDEYMLQIQTGLLVSGRKWCDFISYCGGLHLFCHRVYPDAEMQESIIQAVIECEQEISRVIGEYKERSAGLHLTERLLTEEEMTI